MSSQEHFHVFETLLYGLAIAHILIGVSKMTDHRRTIRFYWLHGLTVLTLLLTILHRYFIAFNAPSFKSIHYAYEFLFLLFLPLSTLFFSAYHIIPSKVKNTDFKEFFWSRSTILLTLFLVFLVLLVIRNYIEFSILFDGQIPLSFMIRGVYSILVFTLFGLVAVLLKKRGLITAIIISLFLFITFLLSTAKLGWEVH